MSEPKHLDWDELKRKTMQKFLEHYGTPRHSGRYPWGSGKNPQRNRNFIQRADELAAQGLSKVEIARAFGLSSGDYIAYRKMYSDQVKMENQAEALKLHDKGWSNVAIANKLGVSEGTVRNMLNPNKKKREDRVAKVAEVLKEELKNKPYLDIGEGVDRQLNISGDHLHSVEIMLKDQGYNVYNFPVQQLLNPKQFTNMKILCEGNVTRAEVKEHLGEVTTPNGIYFKDYATEVVRHKPIPSISSKRISIVYDEDKGGEKDGVIEIRPGVEDLSLGGRRYAQVRIAVDGTHYLKGMAVYGDPKKMPEGVDIVFNTSKHKGIPALGKGDDTVLKEMKKDPTNPFGASFRQFDYNDADGKSHISPINIVNDDSDWDRWKKNLSSQFLSKQPRQLARQQLDLRYAELKDEFADIKSLTNPTLKRQFLDEFADNCDSAAVHLKAAALPRQGSYAILPVNSLKDNEVYAPMYDQGEEVVLVRHPHEGVFQIPRLIVNNNNKEGKALLGNTAQHAIGINSTVANQLSGADYDGDTVLVIPTRGQNIHTEKVLEGLKDYNPSDYYERDPNDPRCTGKSRDGKIGDKFNKGLEMGIASNLITDMTIKRASLQEIERAVKYSMCIIDAEKHNLDWQRCARDQGISKLKEMYQLHYDEDGKPHYGASTLISRAKNPVTIPKRKEVYGHGAMTPEELKRYNETGYIPKGKMTPEELERYNRGEIVYRDANETYLHPKTGKVTLRTEDHEQMALAKDARSLSAGYVIEELYAAHANRLKALANEARLLSRTTGKLERNSNAAIAYADVVGKDGSLAKKIARAELEAPKERQAQLLAKSIMDTKIEDHPELKDKENADKRKKLASKALEEARDAVNGGVHEKRYRIELTDREWEAIQSGAISDTMFQKVIRYSDSEKLKQRAMPRASTGLKPTARSRAIMLLKAGNSMAAVAKELGVSTDTLRKDEAIMNIINSRG